MKTYDDGTHNEKTIATLEQAEIIRDTAADGEYSLTEILLAEILVNLRSETAQRKRATASAKKSVLLRSWRSCLSVRRARSSAGARSAWNFVLRVRLAVTGCFGFGLADILERLLLPL